MQFAYFNEITSKDQAGVLTPSKPLMGDRSKWSGCRAPPNGWVFCGREDLQSDGTVSLRRLRLCCVLAETGDSLYHDPRCLRSWRAQRRFEVSRAVITPYSLGRDYGSVLPGVKEGTRAKA